jgi:hypothetical protein
MSIVKKDKKNLYKKFEKKLKYIILNEIILKNFFDNF